MKKIFSFFLFFISFINLSYSAGYYNAFFAFKSPKLGFTTSIQSLYVSNCSNVVTIQTRNESGVGANVTSNLTVNLVGSGGMTFYSDSTCTTSISSVTVLTGTKTASFYFISTSAGSLSLSAFATSYQPVVQATTISTNPFVWTGGGGNTNWSTNANWSGGVAPNSTQIALFDGTCSSNCSPSITASINVKGIKMTSEYAGTITQNNGFTMTVGANGWVQAAGTFTGSSGGDAITVNGPIALLGGNFTSTSGILSAGSSWVISGTPSFTANNGTLLFTASTATGSNFNLIPGSLSYNHVNFSTNRFPTYDLNGGTMVINGTLTFNGTGNVALSPAIKNGNFNTLGDVALTNYGLAASTSSSTVVIAGSGNQTISGVSTASLGSLTINSTGGIVSFSGSIVIGKNYTYTAGTVDTTTNSSTLIFNGRVAGESLTITPGNIVYNNLTFTGSYFPTYDFGGNTMTVNGLLTFNGSGSNLNSNARLKNGILKALGNITATNYGTYTYEALPLIVSVEGSGNQTITGSPSAITPPFVINSSGGVVTLNGTIHTAGWNYTAGSVDTTTNSSTLSLCPGTNTARNLNPGAVVYYNVTFGCGSFPIFNLNGATMTISGNLLLAGTYTSGSPGTINNGTLQVAGNISTANFGMKGTAAITLNGNSTQSLTQVSNSSFPTGNITVATTGGATVNLASDLSWNNTGQTTTVTSGSINMSGYALTVKSLSLNSTTVTKSGGVLTVNGAAAGTGSLFGGTVDP